MESAERNNEILSLLTLMTAAEPDIARPVGFSFERFETRAYLSKTSPGGF